MLLYRIAEEQFARDLSVTARGSTADAGTPRGFRCSILPNRWPWLLLRLVRLSTPKRYSRIVYGARDEASLEIMTIQSLRAHWLLPYPNASLMEICGRWARERRSLLLKGGGAGSWKA